MLDDVLLLEHHCTEGCLEQVHSHRGVGRGSFPPGMCTVPPQTTPPVPLQLPQAPQRQQQSCWQAGSHRTQSLPKLGRLLGGIACDSILPTGGMHVIPAKDPAWGEGEAAAVPLLQLCQAGG